jgi:hypothetical protein
MLLQGQVGPITTNVSLGSGVNAPFRQTNTGDLAISEVHAKYYEQVYRGNVYSGGTTIAALSGNTITLVAATTPILGVWNPSYNTVNLVLLYAQLMVAANNFTSGAAAGVFVWASSTGNTSISTGSAPVNRKTLVASGSSAKYFPLSGPTAITGRTNDLVIAGGTPFSSPTALTYGTIVSTVLQPCYGGIWDIGGSIIIPPGGLFAILNTNSSTVFSAAGELVWEEVPV